MSTHKVFDLQMNLEMLLQEIFCTPTDRTIRTLKLSTFDVLCFLVAVKFALVIEVSVTNGARISVLTLAVVYFVFVGLQVVLVLEDTFTHVTLKGAAFTVLSRNVQIYCSFAYLPQGTRGTLEISCL